MTPPILTPPTVVNIRKQEYDIYIGLGSIWGNKFRESETRSSAIRAYERRMRSFLESDPSWRVELKALAGKRIGCHCAPRPCHGDVLVKLFLELYGSRGTMESGEPACDTLDGNHNSRGGF